jgi:hypothetical protein
VEVLKEWSASNPDVGMPAVIMVAKIAQKHGGYLYSGTPEADAFNKSPQIYKDEGVKGVINAPAGYQKLPLKVTNLSPAEIAARQSDCTNSYGAWDAATNTCQKPSSYSGLLDRGFLNCQKKGGSFVQTGTNKGICYPAGVMVPSSAKLYVPPPKVTPGNGTTPGGSTLVAPGSSGNTGMIIAAVAVVGLGAGAWWFMKRRKAKAAGVAGLGETCGCSGLAGCGCDGLAGAPRRRKRSRR